MEKQTVYGWFCFFMFYVVTFSLNAQTLIKGTVRDYSRKPISSVVVKALLNGNLVNYTLTDKDGNYTCTIHSTSENEKVMFVFSKLGYAMSQFPVRVSQSQRIDVQLREEIFKLREVVAKAPAILLQGDTIRYTLKSFTRSEDISLEDGLKRIPGIKVDATGAISYMGQYISQFYIEGLNMLGGKYNLATRNIPVDKVTGVEVLRHHQDYKINKKEMSDDVALNIKLSPKAKIKPFGTYEGRIGFRDDNELLYGLGGTAMLFRANIQTLATLKLANDGRLGTNELENHFGSSSLETNSWNVLPALSASQPPLQEYRYKDVNNQLVSVNAIRKISIDVTLNANADYEHHHKEYGYDTESQYPTADKVVTTREFIQPVQASHQAGINLVYKSNKEQRLLINTTNLRAQFRDNTANTFLDDKYYGQEQSMNGFSVKNALELQKRIKDWKWVFKSDLQYIETPKNKLNIITDVLASDWIQQAKSKSFNAKFHLNAGYYVKPDIIFAVPLDISWNYNRIETDLIRPDKVAANLLKGFDLTMNCGPYLSYQAKKNNLKVQMSLPIVLQNLNYTNDPVAKRQNEWLVCVSPLLYYQYIVNSKNELNGRIQFKHNYGDMLDLLTYPVQTDYRSLQTRSGVWGKNKVLSSNLYYKWQNPMSFWFFNSSIIYSRQWSNVLKNQQLTEEEIEQSAFMLNNTSDRIGTSAELSKYILDWRTNLLMGGEYSWRKSLIGKQGIPTTSYYQSYSIKGEIRFTPLTLFELYYIGRYSKSFNRYNEVSNITDAQSHRAHLIIRPTSKMHVYATTEYMRTELISNDYKQFTLLDIGGEYKIKKFRIKLEINNLLNRREYAYTLYNGLNSYSYNYRLQGREFLLSLSLM